MVGKLQCRALSLVALGSVSYVILVFQDDGRSTDRTSRCRKEHWSCAVVDVDAGGPGSCADLTQAECEGGNGTWLGVKIPSSWQPNPRFSNCFNDGAQLACMPQLINLAPPKSGTTKIYQQLLGTETVIPSGTPSKSLCEGRPLAWCQKEPTFWMKGTATLTRLQDYTSMYQPLSEKLQGSNAAPRSAERLMSVDWSPLNYEANPLVLRHAHPAAHFVALLRNPIHRAESDYNWSFFAVAPSCRKMPKGAAAGSARHMHQLMSMTVQHFGACLEHERSQSRATAERLCWHRSTEDRIISCSSYRTTSAYVLRGLYSVYLRWFLEHFASPHFTVARIEDLHDVAAVLPALRLGPRGAAAPAAPAARAARAAPVLETQRHQVQLLPETTEMLRGFYTPYVKDLQVLFNDTTLSWW